MFPELKKIFMLDPNITYLNHGSYGACPKPVFESLIQMKKKLEFEPTRFLGFDLYTLLDKSRESLSNYIGCHMDDVVFTPNPSTGLNAVIKSLKLNEGDEVLTTNHEYGALDKTWHFICKKTKAKYINQKISLPLQSKKQFINEFSKGITNKTKVIFLSHITSSTALIFPVKEICSLARKKNILCIIDGAHAPGHINLNIRNLNPDVYVGACHKWMCAPKGISFLYVKKNIQSKIDPLVVSWGYESDTPSHSQFLDYHQWQGTKDMSSFVIIPDVINFLNQYDWIKKSQKCRELNFWAKEKINHLLKNKELSHNKFLGQMNSFYINQNATIDYHIYFYKKYKIQIPFIIWNKKSLMRVSIQVYNSEEDILNLLDALKKEMT